MMVGSNTFLYAYNFGLSTLRNTITKNQFLFLSFFYIKKLITMWFTISFYRIVSTNDIVLNCNLNSFYFQENQTI